MTLTFLTKMTPKDQAILEIICEKIKQSDWLKNVWSQKCGQIKVWGQKKNNNNSRTGLLNYLK